jgi:hypothetical protein
MKMQLYAYTGTGTHWGRASACLELQEATVEFMPCRSIDFEAEADGVGVIFPVHIWGLPKSRYCVHQSLQVKT